MIKLYKHSNNLHRKNKNITINTMNLLSINHYFACGSATGLHVKLTVEWDELPTSGTPPLGELSFIYMPVD